TLLVTIGAVASVTAIALDRARTDRRFYVNELGVRTSQLLADVLSERLSAWKSRLLLATAGGNAGRFDLGDFESLAICDRTRCEPVAGDQPPADAVARARSALESADKRDLTVASTDKSRIILAAGDKQATAVATIPEDRLLDLRGVPQDLGVFVVDAEK